MLGICEFDGVLVGHAEGPCDGVVVGRSDGDWVDVGEVLGESDFSSVQYLHERVQ